MRRFAIAVVTAAIAVVATGCAGSGGFQGIYSIPLPGGAALGDHPYHVTAGFSNAVNLTPQAAVKVNGVAVGRVTRIWLPPNGWTANVGMVINGKVRLPANAVAELDQSSLLGEKYVTLKAPPDGTAAGVLRDGTTIPLSRTDRTPEVEEVLGALSLLLNGGGINQLHTITVQLNDALSGNEPKIRELLVQVDNLVTGLNTHRGDITQALDGVNRLSATLASRDFQIGNVLDSLSPGLRVLDTQRHQLVTLLNALDNLSGVAVDTLNRSKAGMVAELNALAPTLRRLADAGTALPNALQVLLTFPFTDQVLKGIKGDYLNAYLSVAAVPGTTIIPPLTPSPTTPAAGTDHAPLPLPGVSAPGGG